MKKSIFICMMLLYNGNLLLAQSHSYKDSLLALIKTDLPDTNKVEHLNRLGWDLQYSNPDSAILLSNQALQICYALFESPEAKKNEAYQTRIKRNIAQTFNCLGVFNWMASDYKASIDYHRKALELRRDMHDISNEATSLNNLGLVYKAQGDFNEALKSYLGALALSRTIGDKELISNNITNVGTVYHDMKDYKKALDCYFISTRLYKETGDMIGLSMTYSYMGNAFVKLGENKRALMYYEMGYEISEEIDYLFLKAFQANNIGEVYMMMKDYEKGLEYFERSLPMAQQVGDLALVSAVLGNQGNAYMDLGDYEKAEGCVVQALDIAVDIHALPEVESNTKTLSDLYARTKRFEKAYELQSEYIKVHDSLYNDTRTKELGQLETRHELELERVNQKLAEEMKAEKERQRRNRLNLLQYSGIMFVLLAIAFVIIILGRKKVNVRTASAITFFAFLLFFEFMLVLLDPWVDSLSRGEPVFKLFFNAIIAACIFPLHSFFERKLHEKLIRK